MLVCYALALFVDCWHQLMGFDDGLIMAHRFSRREVQVVFRDLSCMVKDFDFLYWLFWVNLDDSLALENALAD